MMVSDPLPIMGLDAIAASGSLCRGVVEPRE
jgi:hypothetical protein